MVIKIVGSKIVGSKFDGRATAHGTQQSPCDRLAKAVNKDPEYKAGLTGNYHCQLSVNIQAWYAYPLKEEVIND